MTNSLLLKAEIVRSGKKRIEIAEELGISLYTLHKKINNQVEFKASEIAKLRSILSIENPDSIFFASKVDLKSTNIHETCTTS